MIKRGIDDFPEYSKFLAIDEVGYGSAAGPLVLCGVILPNDIKSDLFIDSKKLSDKKKYEAFNYVENQCEFFLAHASVKFINKYGVVESMKKCVNDIITHFEGKYDLVLMDGVNWYGDKTINHKCIAKGDNTYQEIAVASIIAKIKRDEYMVKLHEHCPNYFFDSNKGYLSEKHRNSLSEHGITPYHRIKYVETWLNKQK